VSNLTLSGGTLVTGPMRVTGAMSWTGGTISGAAATEITAGATLTLSGSSWKNLAGGRVLDNAGTIRWSDSGGVQVSSGSSTFTNRSGALFEIQGDSAFNAGYWEGLTIVNAGTLRKTGGTGTTTLGYSGGGPDKVFHNRGVVEVQSGTLRLDGRGAHEHTGSFTVAAGAALDFRSGAHTLANCIFAGAGTLRIQTGLQLTSDVNFSTLTVTLEDNASFAGQFNIFNAAGGVITLRKNLTIPAALTIAGTFTVPESITATINGALTLETGAVLNNAGTVRVRAFVNNGGTINGKDPIIGGDLGVLSARIVQIKVSDIQVGRAGLDLTASERAHREIVLLWEAQPGQRFVIQASTDLVHWAEETASIVETEQGKYQALFKGAQDGHHFFRLLWQGRK
jgi:hypothetical protein